MRVAMLFATVAAVSMVLGLLRWPSVHWSLANAYATGSEADRAAISFLFAGLNSFLGNYIGEFLGELSYNLFFLISAIAMVAKGSGFARWLGYLGLLTAALGLVGMLRNVTPAVDAIAAVNNYQLPLWMIIFGVALFRFDSGVRRDSLAAT
jgi:hypothetical protein